MFAWTAHRCGPRETQSEFGEVSPLFGCEIESYPEFMGARIWFLRAQVVVALRRRGRLADCVEGGVERSRG
jgi:hypothetical protein